ncbi:His-Xaa-Ser system radical SAM maturase HxsB [Planctomicrobium sp. SH661]|uniref:His-Xaa-Ser system radical SAM maturase HxsB n=1 Tax=Planctomicrobium sp. SH661 TaxID=3448124 RepID=UPI003F5C4020
MQFLPILNDRFTPETHYRTGRSAAYSLLPFRFIRLDSERYVVTNFVGEHFVLPERRLQEFIRHQLPQNCPEYDELKAKHFLVDGDSTVALDLLSVKYRTKQAFLSNCTGLFLFIVSLRCDHSCPYCQVSRQSTDKNAFDMSPESAEKAIEFMFQSPSPTLKVEFQGGEPLLNFELIRAIVERVNARNQHEGRQIQYVITSNLVYLTDEILEFAKLHEIDFSTSLDGPEGLHNRNRPRPGANSYQLTMDGIRRIRESLGADRVAALMTTTEASLSQVREIIDEYVALEFDSIFLRPLSPYGFAVKTGMASRYQTDQWLEFYHQGLAHLLEWNRRGIPIREEYASLILRKMLTPYPTGYVDLQSPSGIGISVLAFNYNGDIYASDEGRMLAETGDQTFRLGNLHEQSFDEVLSTERFVEMIRATMAEAMPMCSDCGFLPYCGSDPVYHHATQGDLVGFKPTSGFCQKNMGIFRQLIQLLEDDPSAAAILRSWI